MNYFEHHIGDYLRDTAHLSLLEHGVYRRLMDVYYTREAPLPADPSRLIGARAKEEREAVQSVLEEFFCNTGDGWSHKRCDAEIARFHDKQRKAKASADARWSAQRSSSDGNANASSEHDRRGDAANMRTHCEGNATCAPVPTPQTPDPTSEAKLLRVRSTRRCPPAFAPPEGFMAELRAECPGVDIERELRKFRDHTFGTARSDWPATLRNWIRRAAETRGGGEPVSRFGNGVAL